MSKKYLTILISLLVIGVAFVKTDGFGVLNSSTAFAVGDLVVDWGIGTGNVGPIFTVANMAPGQSQTRTVNIQNDATTPRPVAVRGIQTATDSAGLANVMDIVISDGATDLYGGSSPTGPKTLMNFFNESWDPSGIDLFTLNNGANKDIDFKVTFMSSAGNEYQNKSITFDIQIGIGFDLPEACINMFFEGQTIFGTEGNDRINGGNKSQLIVGLEGNDTISGGNKQDCIVGGPGNDTLSGGNHKDIIDGGEGDDRIIGGNQDDTIIGGDGNDNIDGGNDADNINGGLGNDTIAAGNGNDIVDGGDGNDTMTGQNGNDNLFGGAGTDSAHGGNGTDTCSAETENFCEI